MCLYPISIRNPTKVVHTGGGQLLKLQVPCGHCAQCFQAKRNEWYIRTHYEIERTYSLGGYVYFDTLTYDDAHLPKLSHFLDVDYYGISDFSCFNHGHFKAFLKRLRRQIAYHYGIKKDCFRYFLTTEYGEDNRYTHRPHYHILFFVYGPILPLKFSELVSKCWSYGRTDGFPYKPSCYVAEHTYTKVTDFKTTTSVAMYVSKYITKSSGFVKNLNERISLVKAKLLEKRTLSHPRLTDDEEELLKDLKRNINMFHRQSQGFGLSYLDNLTPFKCMFLDIDKVILKDSNKIVKTYPLPMYYKRKLYYELKKHSDGSRYWEATDNGVNHILNAKLARVDSQVLKYMDIIRNCYDDNLKQEFFKLLDGRDISEFVVYEQFYRGRHRSPDGINYELQTQKQQLTYEEFNLNDWLLSFNRSLRPYSASDSLLQVSEEKTIRTPVLSVHDYAKRAFSFEQYGHSYLVANSHSDTVDDYYNTYTFNENSDYIFRHFDKLALLIIMMTEKQRESQQMTFDYLEDLKQRYKTLFNLNL